MAVTVSPLDSQRHLPATGYYQGQQAQHPQHPQHQQFQPPQQHQQRPCFPAPTSSAVAAAMAGCEAAITMSRTPNEGPFQGPSPSGLGGTARAFHASGPSGADNTNALQGPVPFGNGGAGTPSGGGTNDASSPWGGSATSEGSYYSLFSGSAEGNKW